MMMLTMMICYTKPSHNSHLLTTAAHNHNSGSSSNNNDHNKINPFAFLLMAFVSCVASFASLFVLFLFLFLQARELPAHHAHPLLSNRH
jgi:hypothetical protein